MKEAPSSGKRQALLGLGSNLGSRRTTLQNAVIAIESLDFSQLLVSSPIYESEPVGYIDQPLFLNMVVGIETGLSPENLLGSLAFIEGRLGRRRSIPNGPRTIDIDILFYEGETRRTLDLTLPHPRYAERPFVVVPLKDVLRDPLFQTPTWVFLHKELLTNTNANGLRRY